METTAKTCNCEPKISAAKQFGTSHADIDIYNPSSLRSKPQPLSIYLNGWTS